MCVDLHTGQHSASGNLLSTFHKDKAQGIHLLSRLPHPACKDQVASFHSPSATSRTSPSILLLQIPTPFSADTGATVDTLQEMARTGQGANTTGKTPSPPPGGTKREAGASHTHASKCSIVPNSESSPSAYSLLLHAVIYLSSRARLFNYPLPKPRPSLPH